MRAHAGIRARHETALVPRRARGFTIIEIVIVLAIAAVIAAVALPRFQDYSERTRVFQAVTDIGAMNVELTTRMNDTHAAPADLSEIGAAGKLDPWGRPYVYQNLAVKGAIGKARKNKNLVPINTYYDLYSMGKDGASSGPLTAGPSRDDVILANDGKFIGLASNYE
jgi:general secretion pathway protein G